MSQPSLEEKGSKKEILDLVRQVIAEEKEKEMLYNTLRSLSSQLSELSNSITSNFSKVSEIEKRIETLTSQVSKIQTLDQLVAKMQEIESLKQELQDLKTRVAHKHNWAETKEGMLECKDCNTSIPLPPDYIKLKTTKDLISYIFKPHQHGQTIFDDLLSCPNCRDNFVEELKKRGYSVNVSGDELRLKMPKKK